MQWRADVYKRGVLCEYGRMRNAKSSECELLNEGVCMFGGNPHLCSGGLL